MKEFLTIGEFAKLKSITTETLRHYDRIGILKPMYIDKNTNYRYYSILQYERLATILELRQLGMDLKEIKNFLEERNVKNGLELLEERNKILHKEIEQLKYLEKKITKKIKHIKSYLNKKVNFEPEIKYIEERTVLTLKDSIKTELEMNYGSSILEEYIKEISPIFAENKYAFKVSSNLLIEKNRKLYMMLFLENIPKIPLDSKIEVETISNGYYACVYFYGYNEDTFSKLNNIKINLINQGYKISKDIIFIAQLDISLTGKEETVFYEAQILLEK